ncbi:hypothetical protein BBO99_00002514 [Phytophthora kernoviae]|uniref:Glucosidase 2 subunit beta n=2 Tax=Phytophthora kernoviae TaxID=325452 RepID=A0A3R7JYM7_9STRA|nr:hypothetical protein G195_002890 [Phytophthora kernoviae 00238/432]KAG2525105.1 hypothetical protein JM16_004680 [Phytophthora kernoviae]KAG2530638.1 hypothetical protein JM18_002050 [Phytophthora kernoviae]RLN36810.1 hypothetical protein BBI17_002394 [Phytophthora kernoviae]RLN82934.1 hypothetical protein BBO99_00002514 [Phytophthora kernoviae]
MTKEHRPQRRTMIKSTVGHVRRSDYDLPDAKNPNHVYGYEVPRDPENAGQVIGKWVHAIPSVAANAGRSFIETNRQAIKHGESEDIWGLVQARYTSYHNDNADYPDLSGMKAKGIHTSRVDDGICDCCDGSDEALGSQCKNTCSAAAEVVRKEAEERLEVVRAGFAKRQAVVNGEIADYFAAEQDSVSSKSKELEALTLLKERVVVHKEREELRERKYRLDVARQRQAESQSGTSEGGEEAHREQFSDAAEKEAVEALDFEGLDAIRIADEDAPVNTAEDERASEVLDTRMHSLKSFIELSDHTRVSLAEYLRMDHRPPPTKKFPKLDDQVTLPVAKSLREALREIEADINKLEKERGEKYEAAKADFGPDRAFFSLKDKCIEQRIEKYLYKFCAFGEVKQDKTKLGKWEGWVIDETSTSSTGEPYVGHTKMKYSRGQKCYKGPERSVIVHLECGIEDQIVSVDEPSTCIYSMVVRSPFACTAGMLAKAQDDVVFWTGEH